MDDWPKIAPEPCRRHIIALFAAVCRMHRMKDLCHSRRRTADADQQSDNRRHHTQHEEKRTRRELRVKHDTPANDHGNYQEPGDKEPKRRKVFLHALLLPRKYWLFFFRRSPDAQGFNRIGPSIVPLSFDLRRIVGTAQCSSCLLEVSNGPSAARSCLCPRCVSVGYLHRGRSTMERGTQRPLHGHLRRQHEDRSQGGLAV